MINHVVWHVEYPHPFLIQRDQIKRVGYIIVSSDRGLCGGLNINLFRKVIGALKQNKEQGVDIDLCLIGRKANAFFNRFGGNVVASAENLGDKPRVEDLIGMIKVMLDNYMTGTIDALYIASNEFINTMIQRPTITQLWPLTPDESELKNIGIIYTNLILRKILSHMPYTIPSVSSCGRNIACFHSAM